MQPNCHEETSRPVATLCAPAPPSTPTTTAPRQINASFIDPGDSAAAPPRAGSTPPPSSVQPIQPPHRPVLDTCPLLRRSNRFGRRTAPFVRCSSPDPLPHRSPGRGCRRSTSSMGFHGFGSINPVTMLLKSRVTGDRCGSAATTPGARRPGVRRRGLEFPTAEVRAQLPRCSERSGRWSSSLPKCSLCSAKRRRKTA